LKVHLRNYACLTSFGRKWGLACICASTTIFPFVSKRLMNRLGSKPIACICQRYVKCGCRGLNKRSRLVLSCILILIFLFRRTDRNRKMRTFWTYLFIFCCHLCFPSRITGDRKINFNYCATTGVFPTSCWINLVWITGGTLSFRTWVLLNRFNFLQINLKFCIIILSCLNCRKTGCTFLLYFFKKCFLLLPDVVFNLFSWIIIREYYYGWFYTLINIALSIGWRHHNDTR